MSQKELETKRRTNRPLILHPLHQRRKGERALTLVETILAIALFLIVAFLVVAAINLSQTMLSQQHSESNVEGNLKRSLDIVSRDLREALQTNVTITNNNSYITFQTPESTDLTGTSYKTIEYSFDSSNQTLSRRETSSTGNQGSWQVTGRKLSDVDFSKTSNSVQIISVGTNNETQKTEVFLRNTGS